MKWWASMGSLICRWCFRKSGTPINTNPEFPIFRSTFSGILSGNISRCTMFWPTKKVWCLSNQVCHRWCCYVTHFSWFHGWSYELPGLPWALLHACPESRSLKETHTNFLGWCAWTMNWIWRSGALWCDVATNIINVCLPCAYMCMILTHMFLILSVVAVIVYVYVCCHSIVCFSCFLVVVVVAACCLCHCCLLLVVVLVVLTHLSYHSSLVPLFIQVSFWNCWTSHWPGLCTLAHQGEKTSQLLGVRCAGCEMSLQPNLLVMMNLKWWWIMINMKDYLW